MATDPLPVRVLLVEDDEDDYVLTRGLFDRMRAGAYQLDWTADPEVGLADMCQGGHDVYLLDYQLGARTGVDLLRQALETGSVLAILLTGLGEAEADRQALEAGAADYLEKGRLDATTLDRAIRYALTQRRHEEALRRSHDELERRVADRTRELAEVNRALQEADRRKNEFLAVLAHELRNPLAPLRTAAELMRLEGTTDPRRQRLHEIVARQVAHMARLVDDLLEVSRITSGKINLVLEPVSLSEAVSNAVETTRPLVDNKRQHLTVALPAEPVMVRGDKVRLAQVIGNLLQNAAKYTDPEGRIRVEVERGDDRVIVRVSDSGIGIPAEMLSRVFEPFFQLNSTLDRSQGGLGVGLSLVKTLIELHGGRVQAASDGRGCGSVFTLFLPV